jgi:hypothetical protein
VKNEALLSEAIAECGKRDQRIAELEAKLEATTREVDEYMAAASIAETERDEARQELLGPSRRQPPVPGGEAMIKEIEQLQDDLPTALPSNSRTAINHIYRVVQDTLGLLHQLAVKVTRLEEKRAPAPYVPDSEEGGL